MAKVLVCKASNCGSYELLVPGGLTPGQYVVRIESSVNRAVVADSAEFTVECAGSAPAISEVAVRQLIWHGGSRQQVTWSSQGEVPAVDLCLHHALGRRKLVKTLIRKANNSGPHQSCVGHEHEVLVPDGLTPGHYVVRVEACAGHSFAITAAGTLFAWGAGYSGVLGHGNRKDQLQPKSVAALADIPVTSQGVS